jgi:hypothetical protein
MANADQVRILETQNLTGVSAAEVDLAWLRAATRAFSLNATRMETRPRGVRAAMPSTTTVALIKARMVRVRRMTPSFPETQLGTGPHGAARQEEG